MILRLLAKKLIQIVTTGRNCTSMPYMSQNQPKLCMLGIWEQSWYLNRCNWCTIAHITQIYDSTGSKTEEKSGKLWVLTPGKGMGYGVTESYGILSGNHPGGSEILWGWAEYGLWQIWVRTEATVFFCQHKADSGFWGDKGDWSMKKPNE
jgi:hypothetical protein